MGLPNGKSITSNVLSLRYRVYGRLFVIEIKPKDENHTGKSYNPNEDLGESCE